MFKIQDTTISPDHKPFVIAEMSGNHNQSLERAFEIVDAAAEAGAHALKLQTYTADTITFNGTSDEFVINDQNSLWKNQNLHKLYQMAYTPWEWHKPIFDRAKAHGMLAFSSPFDTTAVDFLESLDVPCYKIASFENTDHILLKKVAQILRDNAFELALLDAANCGNPISEMQRDALIAAAQIDYYAGLATEIKGETIPMGDGILNYSVREPYGVCARIVAYNHPIMFTASKMAPPLITGNTVIMKPPYQAPLSAYRMMELIDGILPPGVLNIISSGAPGGQALVNHPLVPRLSLIGSVPTGRAIAKAAADQRHVMLNSQQSEAEQLKKSAEAALAEATSTKQKYEDLISRLKAVMSTEI